MLYLLRKRKYNPKVIQGSSGLPAPFQRVGPLLPFLQTQSLGQQSAWGDAAPQRPRKEEHQTKEDASQALKSNGICPTGLCTYSEPVTSFFFPMNPFEKETVSHARPITVLWKLITCLVSQVHSWRGILLQDESPLSFQPYLIQMRLWTWELMQERVDILGVTAMEWIYFACGETMNFGGVGREVSIDWMFVSPTNHMLEALTTNVTVRK